jgi:hypothetical protein
MQFKVQTCGEHFQTEKTYAQKNTAEISSGQCQSNKMNEGAIM